MVWLASFVENQQGEIDLVQGYLDHDIPVGAVNIDSKWSIGINNFVWDTTKFPNAKSMVDHFHSLDIRVILWVGCDLN